MENTNKTIKWKVGRVNHEISFYSNGNMRVESDDEVHDRWELIDIPKKVFKKLMGMMTDKL